ARWVHRDAAVDEFSHFLGKSLTSFADVLGIAKDRWQHRRFCNLKLWRGLMAIGFSIELATGFGLSAIGRQERQICPGRAAIWFDFDCPSIGGGRIVVVARFHEAAAAFVPFLCRLWTARSC